MLADPPLGFEPIPAGAARARMAQLHEIEVALLGVEYLRSRRITRLPVGRVRLPRPKGGSDPEHADVFLVTHTTGVALWEAWIPLPDQPLDAVRFVEWLRSDVTASPAALLQERIASLDADESGANGVDDGFPFTILRHPPDVPSIDAIATQHGGELVQLLYLDRSRLAFKPGVIDEELARDFCLREGGISLLGARSALDLRTGEAMVADPDDGVVLAPRSALPLLVSVELLLLERAVLRLFHRRLVDADVPGSLARLVDLKAEVLDGLEEYRGTVAESNRFSSEVTGYGEQVLGLDVLYRTLNERLDSVTFDITTSYQRTTNVLQFSLTVVLGALQASSVAAVISSVRYVHRPLVVLAWAVGAGLAAASIITLLLRRRLR